MATTKFRVARDPISGAVRWSPKEESSPQAWLGWLIMAFSTVLLVLVGGYFAYWLLFATPSAQSLGLPDGGSREMRQQVQQLRLTDRR